MIRLTKPKLDIVIDLDGPDGNAFQLMATAKRLAGWSEIEITPDELIAEMMSGDYMNLVKTFDKYLGSIVVLETTNEELLNA